MRVGRASAGSTSRCGQPVLAAQFFQHAVQRLQVAVMDHQPAAAAAAVQHVDDGAERFGQLALERGDVGLRLGPRRLGPARPPGSCPTPAAARDARLRAPTSRCRRPAARARSPPARAASAARAHGPSPARGSRPARGCPCGISSRRSRLDTAARERPTASAACAWVRSNSSISRCSACASSSGLRSSRWMFSISAIATTVRSSTSRTTAGISVRPASCAARQRRSPAMISKRAVAAGRARRSAGSRPAP